MCDTHKTAAGAAGLAAPLRAHDGPGVAPLGAAAGSPVWLNRHPNDEGPGVETEAFRGQSEEDGPHCATSIGPDKEIANSAAQGALLGIEARRLNGDAFTLIAPTGITIGTVTGATALRLAVAGFEPAQHEGSDLMARIGRSE